MTDITDKSLKPAVEELYDYVGNALFRELCEYLTAQYKAACEIAYSGDNVLLGWNISFKKAGRTLIRLYPRRGFFTVLLVVGRREKERVEALLPMMSDAMRGVYEGTREGMGQRWLVFDLHDADALYEDTLKLVKIRRESK